VALQDEKIIGWIQAGLVYRLETEPFVEIGGLVVEAAYRGQGIGKKLVERVQQWSVANGQVTLRVRSNTKRREAHQFYRALGFTEAKEQKVFEAGLL
jgi:GNAT superfamily N-acetyltransferase